MEPEFGGIAEGYGELYGNFDKVDEKADCDMFLDFDGEEAKQEKISKPEEPPQFDINLDGYPPTSEDGAVEEPQQPQEDKADTTEELKDEALPSCSDAAKSDNEKAEVTATPGAEVTPAVEAVTNTDANATENNAAKPVCRVCMLPSDCLISMFEKCPSESFLTPMRKPDKITDKADVWYDDQTICDKIKFCSAVQVLETEELSSVICKLCLSDLLIAFRFKKRLEESDEIFRKKLGLKNKTIVRTEFVLIDCDADNKLESDSDDDRPLATTRKKIKSKMKTRKKTLAAEDREKTPEKFKYKCEDCDRSFQYPSVLKTHRVTHERQKSRGRVLRTPPPSSSSGTAELPRDLKCNICHKTFEKTRYLKLHERAHAGDKYPCPDCPDKFGNALKLSAHVKERHRNLKCRHCDRSFKNRVSFQKHVENHRNDKTITKIVENNKMKSTVDLFKTIAPLTTTYWSDSYSD